MKLFSDIFFVTVGGVSVALFIVGGYYWLTDWLETRAALKKFREYEKTQPEEVAKARREGL